MAVLPAEIPTGLVTGQFYFVSEDTVDVDTDPELLVVSGSVTFTCSAPVLRMPTKLATVVPVEFKAKFDSQGRLVSFQDWSVGLELPATNSVLFNPTDFTWRVSFDLVQVSNRHTVSIAPFDIQVPQGTTVDLTTAMPVSTSPGVLTVQGPQGPQGVIGPQGTQGPQGVGVPAGGTALQMIRKTSGGSSTEWFTADKSTVGLSNVDNTADTAKPVSTPTQTALDAKAPLASPAFTGTPTGITKGHVGLGNVDNTADVSKPVATGTVNGIMSAADKAKLDAASSSPTPNTLVKLDAAGRTQVVSPSVAADVANKSYTDAVNLRFSPTGTLATTCDRRSVAAASITALTSGTLRLTAVWLPKGTVVTNLTYLSGAVPVGLTNRWFSLFDSSRNLLGKTADNAAAWSAGATLTLPLTTPYTTLADGLFYVGFCEVASTVTALRGLGGSSNAMAIVPILNGDSTAALTNAASTPSPAAVINPQGGIPYAYVS